MSVRVAQRFASVERSATVALLETVQRLRRSGVEVLDLSGGEPDFPTPEPVVAEAVSALESGDTHYTPSRGVPELLGAVADKLAVENGIHVDPATGVIVTPSAKQALFTALMTVLDPGDEVIVPTPAWVSYPAMAGLLGARAVSAELGAEDGFRLSRRVLDGLVTDRTRALVVNTPANPTGHVLDREEAEEIVAFAVEHDLVLIVDEIYEKIVYDGRVHLSPASLPGAAERTLTVNGFSKAYAMTGWRLGYLAGPEPLISQALKVQEHTVSCAASFVQRGGVAALTRTADDVAAMLKEYAVRRDMTVSALDALPGVTCASPEGAFYAFADIRGTGLTSAAFAQRLLDEAAVTVAPGSAFGPGGEGYVRLSFAASREVLQGAAERLSRLAAQWDGN
ncbi:MULTISPECIES: pyridoxal phosphate-dependent aminotransferase [Streptomyces]|uniref:Aminotransferase n=1 Tax=Streptomyces viridochromogenes TaxID=1938 RepID=A0A0L8LDF7_STRVR|nr:MULTISPECIES: pyridoxal phosphate-dependent aminotransferase [Streptomyces]KOG36180.1 aspartate aminotransferase [Streptomyces viridochromogenes]